MRKRTAKQLGTRHDLNYFKQWTRQRRWLVTLVIAVPVIFLGWLGIQAVRGESAPYSSGQMSRAHAMLAKQCATCHTNFIGGVRVGGFRKHAEDQACLTCHQGPVHHSDQRFTPSCASCHTEHVGSPQLARTSDQNCVQCHSDLQASAGITHFARKVTNFARQHPEFAALTKPDPGTIAFNHAAHMRANLPGPPAQGQKTVYLECADCHRTTAEQDGPWRFGSAKWQETQHVATVRPSHDEGQALMAPVSFDKHCIACHTLPFDRRVAESAPHDKPAVVDAYVRETVAGYLKEHPTAWRETNVQDRRIPGARTGAHGARSAEDWLHETVAEDEALLWRKTCKQCHEMQPTQAADAGAANLPRVLAAAMPAQWFIHATFDHGSHAAVRCDSCHSQAPTSTKTSDVLIPGVASCRNCHKGTGAGAAESGCFLCHIYHDWRKQKPFKATYTIPQMTGQD